MTLAREPEPSTTSQDPEVGLEKFRTYVVYLTAAFLVVAGNAGLFVLIVAGVLDAIAGVAIIAAQIGAAATFLFGAVQSKQTEQAVERATRTARNGTGSG